MDFRVYVMIEMPIIDKKCELFVPIDRRIYELINVLKSQIPELNEGYYESNTVNLYNKTNIIKNSDIKAGTRLILV